MAKGWLDNYGKEDNYNDSSVSAPEGFRGDGYSNVGRNYSPAWGGQFQNGGKAKKQTEGDRAMKTAGKVAEAAYISSWLDKVPYAETVYDAYNFLESVNEGDLVGMGSNLVGALIPGFSGKVIENVAQEYLPKQPQLEKDKFKFNLKSSSSDRQKYLEQYGPGYLNHPGFIKHELYKKQNGGNVYPVNYVPQAAMGGSLPGATGHMYARIGAPSNGKYAKKTLASAQDGKKVKYGTPEYEKEMADYERKMAEWEAYQQKKSSQKQAQPQAQQEIDYSTMSKREIQSLIDDALDKGDFATVKMLSNLPNYKR